MKGLETPVLLVVFKRKKEAMATLNAIREARPKKLYLAGDGARISVPKEAEQVEETRNAILEAIDWECEVKTQFQDTNLGCGPGVLSAINWFFENEEEGIILEDDCVAQLGFFKFAEELLERYRNDQRIGLISGFNNVLNDFGPYSYCFSKYTVCWGWATWRRAWKHMDYPMKWRTDAYADSVLLNSGYLGKDYNYWKRRIFAVDEASVSAWDFQWCFSIALQNQLGIFPNKNLISNIGIGEGATHTTKSPFTSYESSDDINFPLVHPKAILPYAPFDKALYKSRNSIVNTLAWFFPKPIKDAVKRLITLVYNKK